MESTQIQADFCPSIYPLICIFAFQTCAEPTLVICYISDLFLKWFFYGNFSPINQSAVSIWCEAPTQILKKWVQHPENFFILQLHIFSDLYSLKPNSKEITSMEFRNYCEGRETLFSSKITSLLTLKSKLFQPVWKIALLDKFEV